MANMDQVLAAIFSTQRRVLIIVGVLLIIWAKFFFRWKI